MTHTGSPAADTWSAADIPHGKQEGPARSAELVCQNKRLSETHGKVHITCSLNEGTGCCCCCMLAGRWQHTRPPALLLLLLPAAAAAVEDLTGVEQMHGALCAEKKLLRITERLHRGPLCSRSRNVCGVPGVPPTQRGPMIEQT